MAEFSFLSEEWIDALADGGGALPERVGVGGVVRFVMTSTPHGKVQFRQVVRYWWVEMVRPRPR